MGKEINPQIRGVQLIKNNQKITQECHIQTYKIKDKGEILKIPTGEKRHNTNSRTVIRVTTGQKPWKSDAKVTVS